MTSQPLINCVFCVGFLMLVSCGLFKKESVPIKIDRTLIGTIDSVRGDEFVLIRLNGVGKPPGGATLVSQGEAGPANLSLSGEKIGPFVAADIRSGTPEKNDPVYIYKKMSADAEDSKEGGLTYPEDEATQAPAQAARSHADSALPTPEN